MATDARILRVAAGLSLREFFAIYPPRQYLIAWLPRAVFQVVFFSLLARFLGGPGYAGYAVVGAAIQAVYQAVLTFSVASVMWEQGAGTVPLLIASRSSPLLVLIGRNAAMIANGVVTGSVGILTAAAFFSLPLDPASLIALLSMLVLISGSTYGLAMALASIVLRFPELRNVSSGAAAIVVTFVSGVYVPTTYLPGWLQAFAEALPVTHGLRAFRSVLLDGAGFAVGDVIAEILVGCAYLVLARISLSYFLDRGREQGTVDFS
jgi:ABC-2 type transport system permease protein